jgi:HEAT repeat protein
MARLRRFAIAASLTWVAWHGGAGCSAPRGEPAAGAAAGQGSGDGAATGPGGAAGERGHGALATALAAVDAGAPPVDAATAGSGGSAMTSSDTPSRAALRAALGAGTDVEPWSGPAPTGIELFLVESAAPHRPGGRTVHDGGGAARGIAVPTAAGVARRREGADAMRLVLGATRDPILLASAAALTLAGGARPILDPAAAAADEEGPPLAAIAAPAVAGDRLTFWAWSRPGKPRLLRLEVDLAAVRLTAQEADAGDADADASSASPDKGGGAAPSGPVARAAAALAGSSDIDQMAALRDLAALCARKEPGAREAIERAARTLASQAARDEAIRSLEQCHGPETVPLLASLLAGDGDARIRARAARVLGALRDPAARPALEAAAAGDADPKVREAARLAGARLPRP